MGEVNQETISGFWSVVIFVALIAIFIISGGMIGNAEER